MHGASDRMYTEEDERTIESFIMNIIFILISTGELGAEVAREDERA